MNRILTIKTITKLGYYRDKRDYYIHRLYWLGKHKGTVYLSGNGRGLWAAILLKNGERTKINKVVLNVKDLVDFENGIKYK